MKLLVTGGAGYIGSVVATQLAQAGHEVIVLDNLLQGHNKDALPKSVRFIQASIAEVDRFLSASDNIEAVLHFAAFIAAGESVEKPEIYWRNNTVGSLKLMDAMRTLGIKKLIFSSTAAVYGNPAHIPITEDDPKEPTSPYGMTKLAVDMAIAGECIAYGLAATSLRYFNVAGAYGGCGERHSPETHIIPLALAAAVNQTPFYLFGNDYPTADGTCVRDYIHVADLARAHLLALDHLQPGQHTIYNLGNGQGFSNKEVIQAVQDVTGKKLIVEVNARREGDPAILVASSKKARQELGWIPQKPLLKEIITDAWLFYQKYARLG